MKKFLLSLATLLCVGSFASAETETITSSANMLTLNADKTKGTYSSTNFDLTLDKSTSTSDVVNSYAEIRVYKNAELTIAGKNNEQITQIEFTGKSGKMNKMTVDSQTYSWSGTTLTWTGNSTSVTFKATGGQSQITKIVITYTSQGGVIVTQPTFSVPGGKYTEVQSVTLSADAGCRIFYTTDGEDPTDDINDGHTNTYNEGDVITVDKSMTIKAIAFDENDNPSGIATADYTIVLPLEGAEGDGTEANPYNAIAAINEANAGNTAEVYVKGIVVSKSEINTKYGSISYYISADGTATNQFYIYSGLGLGGAKFTNEDELKVGDNVVVRGQLNLHNDAPQFNYNSVIISINGDVPEPIVLEGEGTEDKPFTVADVIAINPTETSSNIEYPDKYWVKGYIVGRCDGNAFEPVFSAEGDAVSASNIVIAPTSDCTDKALCIPVQLPSNSDVRTNLNLKDNATKLGQEVAVYGNIYKYFNNPGVKNTSDYKLASDGVTNIEIDENAPVEYFNLQGVRVDNPTNGLYIMRQGDRVVKVIK